MRRGAIERHQRGPATGQPCDLRPPAVLADGGHLDGVGTAVDGFLVSDKRGSGSYRCHGGATIVVRAAVTPQAKRRTNLHLRVPRSEFASANPDHFFCDRSRVHSASTIRPQVFHSGPGHSKEVMDNTTVVLLFFAILLQSMPSLPASGPSLDAFRIFLRDGRVLSSYGEPAQVEDDLVFVVSQGVKGGAEAHDLITVPIFKVNMERTLEYATALRAAKYGATRGEKEYQEFTADIARAMAAIEASDDKDRRIGIAQVARSRLMSWSETHYGYRAKDLGQLSALMGEVIVELQAAKGISQFSLDFVANVAPAPMVPLLAEPTAAETVSMALTAASVTDVAVERIALLTSANRVVAAMPDATEGLRKEVARALADETEVETAYRLLFRTAYTRADLAVRQGRPATVRRLIQDVQAGDAKLGRRRVNEMAAAMRRLQSELALAIEQRAALDRWARVKDQLQAYEVRVRGVLEGWGSQASTLAAIRDRRRAGPGALDSAARRFSELDRALSALRPPDELQDVHGVLRSAVMMARQGLLIGRRLIAAADRELADNASAAVMGAEMLRARGLADLADALKPRRVR